MDTSDMDINELRKFIEFLFGRYKEKEESNDQLTIALMNLNSELYENRKLLTEIRKDQEKTEREKSQLQTQLYSTKSHKQK